MHDVAEKTIRELLETAGLEHASIERGDLAGQAVFSIRVDDGRTLIGPRGDTIHALDHLAKKIVEARTPSASEEEEEGPRFLVDVNEYRSKQIKDLQSKALMMAERARSFQYDVELSPMSAYERLIVHTTLQGEPSVTTESQGEGRSRRVVIRYAGD